MEYPRSLVSLVIPAHNESLNIVPMYEAVLEVWESLPAYDLEIIYVDDGSRDDTCARILALAVQDPRVKLVEFSRNFGKEAALTAGIEHAQGDAIIMIDADLQHPPALIPSLIQKWEAGADIVIGIRTQTEKESFVRKNASKIFAKLFNSMSDAQMPRGESDFRLVDRCVVDEFLQLSEKRRMTRALINWLGYRRAFVAFEAPERLHGTASYSIRKLIALAIHSFVSNSHLPLRATGYLGVMISIVSGIVGFVVFVQRYVFHDTLSWHVSGPAQLAILLMFLIGVVLMALGLIALYIENIHLEILNRPLYIVRNRRTRG